MEKTPILSNPLAKEMGRIKKNIDNLEKIAEKRIKFEEENFGTLHDSTIDKLDFISKMKSLLKDYSHHM